MEFDKTQLEKKPFTCKIIVLGDSSTGKTSIIRRYMESTFDEDFNSTLGLNITTKRLNYPKKKIEMDLVIWDLAGQDKYRKKNLRFYKSALGVLLVFDLTNSRTFEDIKYLWLRLLNEQNNDEIPTILIGNKSDLTKEREIDHDTGILLANEIQSSCYIETSAKTGKNINLIFKTITNKVLKNLYGNS